MKKIKDNEYIKKHKDLISFIVKEFNGEYEGRTILLILPYGSVNYGTSTPTSDCDLKIFVKPTLDDLYLGKRYNNVIKYNCNDIEIHDIRKLPELWLKANATYLELICTEFAYVHPSILDWYNWCKDNIKIIVNLNVLGLLRGMYGMARMKYTAITKGMPYEETNEGYKRKIKFGYDTKQWLHICRLYWMYRQITIYNKDFDQTVKLPIEVAQKLILIKEEPVLSIDEVLAEFQELSWSLNFEPNLDLTNKKITKDNITIFIQELNEKLKNVILKNNEKI